MIKNFFYNIQLRFLEILPFQIQIQFCSGFFNIKYYIAQFFFDELIEL